MDDDEALDRAARRLLFGKDERRIPGAGSSAAKGAARHTRVKVTMNIDGDIVAGFKARAAESGRSYQMLINDALRDYLEGTTPERLAQAAGEVLLGDRSFIEELAKKVSNIKAGDKS